MLLARSIGLGMLIVLVGSIPRNIFYALNLRHATTLPWAAIVTGAYLWVFWKYLGGWDEPRETSEFRKSHLRARSLPGVVWAWALGAGLLGLVAIVLGLRVMNRFVP